MYFVSLQLISTLSFVFQYIMFNRTISTVVTWTPAVDSAVNLALNKRTIEDSHNGGCTGAAAVDGHMWFKQGRIVA